MLIKNNKKVLMLKPKQINLSPNRIRVKIDDGHLQNLCKSISEIGIVQPLIIRKTDTGFELVSGEYRLRAAISLGLLRVPCIVVKKNSLNAAVAAFCENTLRKNPTPLETALAAERLMLLYNLSCDDIAEKLCVKKSDVQKHLKLLHNGGEEPYGTEQAETAENGGFQKAAFCDIRLFQNSMQRLLQKLNLSGFTANTRKTETEDYVEYKIRVAKQKKEVC